MPTTFLFDRARKHLRTTVTGPVTVEAILAHFQNTRNENALDYSELIDVRQITPPWLKRADIWRAASLIRNFRTSETMGPRAVVASNEIVFGLSRSFANLLADYVPMRVFRDLPEADAWLAELTAPRPEVR